MFCAATNFAAYQKHLQTTAITQPPQPSPMYTQTRKPKQIDGYAPGFWDALFGPPPKWY